MRVLISISEHALPLQQDEQEHVSHEDMINTIKEHHQIVIDQIELKNKEALIDLKDKAEEVSHLRHKVGEELHEVRTVMYYNLVPADVHTFLVNDCLIPKANRKSIGVGFGHIGDHCFSSPESGRSKVPSIRIRARNV